MRISLLISIIGLVAFSAIGCSSTNGEPVESGCVGHNTTQIPENMYYECTVADIPTEPLTEERPPFEATPDAGNGALDNVFRIASEAGILLIVETVPGWKILIPDWQPNTGDRDDAERWLLELAKSNNMRLMSDGEVSVLMGI